MPRVRLLGELTIERGRGREELDLGPKPRALLAILLLRRGGIVATDECIELLWPEGAPNTARTNLRVLATQCRTALGHLGRIEHRGDGYRLDLAPDVAVDIEEFERELDTGRAALRDGRSAAAVGHLGEALALYRGPLVAESPFEEWVAGARGRLAELALAAREDLADALVASGRPRDAVGPLEAVIATDRTREGAYRRLMRAHYLAGEQGEALHAYERCRAALDTELGVDPLPETVALHTAIVRQEPLVAAPTAAPARRSDLPFVGRTRERAAVEDAIAGRRRLVAIVGEAGSGKTRLVEEVLRDRRDLVVLRTRCFESERGLAFRAIADALGAHVERSGDIDTLRRVLGDDALRWVVPVVPELRDAYPRLDAPPELAPDDARAKTVESLGRAVLGLARGRVLAWWLDDVQWADQPTLDVLEFVARRTDRTPLAIVLSARIEELPLDHAALRLLVELGRDGRGERIALVPLGVGDVGELLRAIGGSEALAERVHLRTSGNALFVSELARLVGSGEAPALPDSLRDAILTRVHRAPERARRLLDAASVLGPLVRVDLLSAVAEQPGVVADLAALAERRLLREETASVYAFEHELVREAVYERLPLAQRTLLHRAAADWLRAASPDAAVTAGEIAMHAERGGAPLIALRYTIVAGDDAHRLFALPEALAQYDRAVALANSAQVATPLLAEAYTKRARILELIGRYADALATHAELATLAAQRADRALEADALARQATLLAMPIDARDPERAEVLVMRAIELARASTDRALLARLQWTRMFDALWSGRLEEALAAGEEALREARANDLRDRLASTLNGLSHVYRELDRLSDARDAMDEAVRLFRELGDVPMTIDSLGVLAITHWYLGDLVAMREAGEEGKRLSDAIGHDFGRADTYAYPGIARWEAGDVHGALAIWDEGMAAAKRVAHAGSVVAGSGFIGDAVREAGDLSRAEEVLAAGESVAAAHLPFWRGWMRAGRARVAIARGDLPSARTHLAEAKSVVPGFLRALSEVPVVLAEIELALADGDPRRAASLARQADERGRAFGFVAFSPELALLEGDALAAAGDATGARAALTRARDTARQRGSVRIASRASAALERLNALAPS